MQPFLATRTDFERHAAQVARDLLGMRLVRCVRGLRIGGIITETEGYQGEEDLACHAKAGKTARTAVMYGPPAHAYIYFTYGMHWMLNVVCGPQDSPAAVLIRSIAADEGLDFIAARRSPRPPKIWTNGPGKICQALEITGDLNGIDLLDESGDLWLEPGIAIAAEAVQVTPRIGIDPVPEPWKSQPWRFLVK
jgi:DNA-3-methyladenine glycosylase